ncbi:hypothetical protein MNEG_2540 [Monoraphidium neglectum]|uniref:Uncharacterized protein n=1 Tax=Monoraphidium neglectum TaxID=145388 RepID=A0A0D2LFK8_9CHLO|nr:hypothetical protein MNEG_2540 [Monoraphidium neglectum]KIZ05419.1 hypothetical protein MNEG_2540 [Monoraphidium neglectum]|eukprot:XP_013904438.1 hypothetical protein MNEG_2540 [Monoraphidium neglectum]
MESKGEHPVLSPGVDAQQGDRGTASLAEAMRVDRPVEDDRSHTKASDPPTALPQGRDTGGAAATAQGQP